MSDTKVTMAGLDVRETRNGFAISFKGRVVLRHSEGNAALSYGSGRGSYRMSHGNFRISDRLKRRNPCSRFSLEHEGEVVRVTFPEADLRLDLAEEEGRLVMRFFGADPEVNRLWLRLEATPREHIYGCGEQYSRLDLKGSRVPLWVAEQGVGRGHDLVTMLSNLHSNAGGAWHTTYFPMPTWVSSENWYCSCEISGYARFDFRQGESTWLEFWEIPSRLTIGVEEDPVTTLGSLSRFLGRQPALPDWAHDGVWLGVQGGRETIEKKLGDAVGAGVPVAALWVQDWEGRRETSFGRQLLWDWVFDAESYPDLPQQIDDLRKRGVRFLGYINPFLALEGRLYREASERGLCVKNREGQDYRIVVTTFPAALLDLTNPETVSWIKEIIKKNMIGIGLSGWMADYGEYLPTDAVLHSGEPAESVHNRYPSLWARVNREAVEEAGKLGEVFFFMRAGYLGSARYSTGYWAGDQLSDFSRHDGLPSVIPAALSLGFSSGGIWHGEIGGFTSVLWVKRSDEVFMRWAELAAFSPIMRTHEGNRPDTNRQFNSSSATLAHLARMTKVHTLLKPYHLAVEREYVQTGLPPIRHPYLHYAGDEALHRRQDQYLYGRDMLVAPTIRRGRRRRVLWLPQDRWIHLWSGEVYEGGRHRVEAPIGEPAVFVRAESPFRELFDRCKSAAR